MYMYTFNIVIFFFFLLFSLAQPLGELQSVVDISCSNELHGFAIVLLNGKTAFVTGKSAKFEPKVIPH